MKSDLHSYVRQLSAADTKTLCQRLGKTMEEIGELASFVLPYDNAFATTHRFATRASIIEEIADSMLCLQSIRFMLAVSDEELEEEMWRKAVYWNQLQVRSQKAIDLIPFQVHVTVAERAKEDIVTSFKVACLDLSVKAIVLELPVASENRYDLQTSSKLRGTNRAAYEECERISLGLKERGFDVVRKKVETVPWHPMAPRLIDGKASHQMPPSCYFEAHVSFVCQGDSENTEGVALIVKSWFEELETSKLKAPVFSRSVLKQDESSLYKGIITLRSTDCVQEEFEDYKQGLVKALKAKNVAIEKATTEFSVWDTNISWDESWINPLVDNCNDNADIEVCAHASRDEKRL